MSVSKSLCPVPTEQQPINEYRSLQESCFARWAILERRAFIMRTLIWWGVGSLLAAPIATASFSWSKYPLLCLLTDTAIATGLLLLVMVRLYLGWAYVCNRLTRKAIVYEETGWYDGQTWVKPAAELAHQQLIATYEVQPYLVRLRYCFGILGAGLMMNVLLCALLAT